MLEGKKMLRQRFQAETDVEMEPEPQDWQQYALWLEHLALNELNAELIEENEFLRDAMKNAFSILDEGIRGKYH